MSAASGEAASRRLQIDVCESRQHRPSKAVGRRRGRGQSWTLLRVGHLPNPGPSASCQDREEEGRLSL